VTVDLLIPSDSDRSQIQTHPGFGFGRDDLQPAVPDCCFFSSCIVQAMDLRS